MSTEKEDVTLKQISNSKSSYGENLQSQNTKINKVDENKLNDAELIKNLSFISSETNISKKRERTEEADGISANSKNQKSSEQKKQAISKFFFAFLIY